MVLSGFCNADWGGDLDVRKSTISFVFLFNNVIITWSSRKQPMVALSTIEAKYMVMSQTSYEAIWLQRFLSEVKRKQPPSPLTTRGTFPLSKT
jgi:hypothetical protein